VGNFWKSVFGKKPDPNEEIFAVSPQTSSETLPSMPKITEPLAGFAHTLASDSVFDGSEESKMSELISGSAQSVGRQRDHNEDTIFSLTTILSSNRGKIPFGFYIIADGMGGHQHGEIASEIATLTMVEQITQNFFSQLFKINAEPPSESLRDILAKGIQESHETILRNSPGGGTTLTTVIIWENQMAIAHVGDSRVYSIATSGEIKALTRDHSLVSRLVELGQLTPEEAAVHPQRNVLYRALGQGEPFEPEIITSPAPESGFLLICSDGLWGVISEQEISEITQSAATPKHACQLMVDAANAAGGPDNISAILVKMPS